MCDGINLQAREFHVMCLYALMHFCTKGDPSKGVYTQSLFWWLMVPCSLLSLYLFLKEEIKYIHHNHKYLLLLAQLRYKVYGSLEWL